MADWNVEKRVAFRGGWGSLLTGENQSTAMARAIQDLNSQGYRVVIAIPDRMSLLERLRAMVIGLVTLGFLIPVENLVLVGESLASATWRYASILTPGPAPQVELDRLGTDGWKLVSVVLQPPGLLYVFRRPSMRSRT